MLTLVLVLQTKVDTATIGLSRSYWISSGKALLLHHAGGELAGRDKENS